MEQGMPRIGTKRTTTPRKVLKYAHFYNNPPVIGIMLDGTQTRDVANTSDTDHIRAGMVLGKVASSGKYAPWCVGVTTAAIAGSGTSITVAAATVTELVRRLGGTTGTGWLIGPAKTAGAADALAERITISNATGTTITVSAVTNAFIAGSVITCDDGTQDPLGILYGYNGYPVKVTDEDDSNITVGTNMLIMGVYDESQLITLPADSETKEWLRDKLKNSLAANLISDEVFSGSTLIETPSPTPTPTPSPSPTPTPTPTS